MVLIYREIAAHVSMMSNDDGAMMTHDDICTDVDILMTHDGICIDARIMMKGALIATDIEVNWRLG